MFTAGNSESVRDAFNTALTFAERREDAYRQLRLLSGLSMYLHRVIDAAGSLEVASRLLGFARSMLENARRNTTDELCLASSSSDGDGCCARAKLPAFGLFDGSERSV
jgi:hypothetical protein